MDPLVSVIVPNYNHSKYLDGRIKSILNQTFPDFELILLDDASTDNSIEILYKYKNNPHVTHFVINDKNSGYVFRQWEKGISLAKGKYIWIAESDDLAEPEFLEKTVNLLECHQEANLCFCGSYQIDEDGKNSTIYDFDKRMMPDFDPACRSYIFDSDFFIRHYMVWSNTIYNASGTIFRKDALRQEYFRMIESCKYCGDWIFWEKIIGDSKVIILKDKLNRFRIHGGSTTSKAFYSGATAIETLSVLTIILHKVGLAKRLVCYGNVHRNCRRTYDKSTVRLFNHYYFKSLGILEGVCAIVLERLNKMFLPVFPFTISQYKDIHIKPEMPYEL